MKNLILLFVLLPTIVSAKFSQSAFNIPCDQFKLKVTSCKDYQFSNLHFKYNGALVTAEVLEQKPTKCSKIQKTNFKSYKKRVLEGKVFIQGFHCDLKISTVNVLRPKNFCDTPGAATIRSCFLGKFTRDNKFNYTVLIK